MKKDLNYSEYYGEYKALLTENQAEVFELYYLCDLSLGEISEMKSISRQGVSDALSKARELLVSYENKLGLLKKKRELREIVSSINGLEEKERLLKLIGDI